MGRNLRVGVAKMDSRGHLEEQLYDDGESDGLFVCAPHGGGIEPYTALQALALAERVPEATGWVARGLSRDDTFDHWHITSDDIDASNYELLPEVSDRTYEAAVSFHGTRRDTVIIGGLAPKDQRQAVADAIATVVDHPVTLAGADDDLNGRGPTNIVNRWARDGGVQIEQPFTARTEKWNDVVEAVESVFAE